MKTSVVIPTYNGEQYIGEALESVFAQTTLPDEIVVVDDCSADATPTLVEGFSRTSPVPLRLLRLDRNSGSPARPINTGVAASTGEGILVLDQDDVLLPAAINLHIAALNESREAGYSFTLAGYVTDPQRIIRTDATEDLFSAGQLRQHSHLIPGTSFLRLLQWHGNFVVGFPGFMFRRSLWEQCGPVPEHLRICGDLQILCSYASAAPIAFIAQPGYLRREHTDNLCNNTQLMWTEILEVLLQAYSHDNPSSGERDVRGRLTEVGRDVLYELRRSAQYRRAFQFWRAMLLRLGYFRGAAPELLVIISHCIAYRCGVLDPARKIAAQLRGARPREV